MAVLKTTHIGKAVATDIAALTDSNLTGLAKFEKVVLNTLPLVVEFLTSKGAVGVAVDQVRDVTRELVQSTYNDTKSTKAGTLAALILALLGIV